MEHMWEIANDKEHEWWPQDGSNFLMCTIQNKVKPILALVLAWVIIWLTQIWIIIWSTRKKPHGLIKPHPSMGLNEISSSHNVFVMVYFCCLCYISLVILNILVHCFARMSSPSHFVVSPHQNFCESFTCMSNLLKWYK